ncbi:addiction module antidote protein [Mesorhizobium sp. M2C.T.Ca.TU.002.02.1.1]|jgi:probable addiction module antidote protein|uniref:addiction module antidote protein n=1 Tax=Mesorhizobium sp. M2C.T.Ca.TU.002.02.1.1 TaxID=2496788 RepID=UPI000FCB51D0|nr:addiction module antidote protein [Mesorhizobium sp. M2C.T.Ca.TU.002.02.1.1]RUU56472.1 putative addiction module antidote protein [Mesorhizobium sp. M2C.T.Ca.TU.002.02.1.1]RUU67251.1 putative addiction module antidote protein [Mesorhizobium sp. M2C.T.Ca.TU.009.01.2.1]
MAITTSKWDAAKFLDTEEDIVAYLDAVMEEGDLSFLCKALGDVARSRGMTEIAKKTGMSRESLYKALSEKGNPSLSTVAAVLEAMGLRLSVAPREQTHAA